VSARRQVGAAARRRFAGGLHAGRTRTRDDPRAALRRRLMAKLGAGTCRVFDAFAGDGGHWREAWREAAGYVGCDAAWHRDGRVAFVAVPERVMRAVDLAEFTVFDLDARGNAWACASILARRRRLGPGERIGLIVSTRAGRKSELPLGLARLAGAARRGPGAPSSAARAALYMRAIESMARAMGGRIAWLHAAGNPPGAYGAVIQATGSE